VPGYGKKATGDVAAWALRGAPFADTVSAMVWGVKRTYRKVAAALALLGVAFYALLLPGHLTSQFSGQLHRADIGIFADAICAPDGSPVLPAPSCPICKGVAAYQLALAAPEAIALPVMPHAAPVLALEREDVAAADLPPPRSRGPPLPA